MYVDLNGKRVPLTLGRWDARKALAKHVGSDRDRALIDLVDSSGIHEAAKMLGVEVEKVKRRYEAAMGKAARDKRIATMDLTVVDLIDDLGYEPQQAAEFLNVTIREVHKRYWRARSRLAGDRHDKALVDGINGLSQRDFMAFELVTVLNYSIGRASKSLGLNRGHLCRQIQKVRSLLQGSIKVTPPE